MNAELADGTEVRVVWQVQGNSELGLPTEQDSRHLRCPRHVNLKSLCSRS